MADFPIMKRRAAAEAGLKRYYTGVPCSKGHDAQRFTATGVCVMCNSGYVRAYNQRLAKASNSRAAGVFAYPLHPDDHAGALAFCQALDLQRGRAPQTPGAVASQPAAVPEWLQQRRAEIQEKNTPKPAAPHLPKP